MNKFNRLKLTGNNSQEHLQDRFKAVGTNNVSPLDPMNPGIRATPVAQAPVVPSLPAQSRANVSALPSQANVRAVQATNSGQMPDTAMASAIAPARPVAPVMTNMGRSFNGLPFNPTSFKVK